MTGDHIHSRELPLPQDRSIQTRICPKHATLLTSFACYYALLVLLALKWSPFSWITCQAYLVAVPYGATTFLHSYPSIHLSVRAPNCKKSDIDTIDSIQSSSSHLLTLLERNQSWILLIDNDAILRQTIGTYLHTSGYSISTVPNPSTGITLLTTPHPDTNSLKYPDVLITELRYAPTDLQGLPFIKQIRTSKRWKNVPILISSTRSMTMDRMEGYKAGADAFLVKPFHKKELLAMLDNLVMRKGWKRRMSQVVGSREPNHERLTLQELSKHRYSRKQGSVTQAPTHHMIPKMTNTENSSRRAITLKNAEEHVLELVCQGLRQDEIVKELGNKNGVMVGRVLSRLYEKSGEKTRKGLIVWSSKRLKMSVQEH